MPKGQRWTGYERLTFQNLHALWFTDENHGWAAGANGVTLKYVNGSWSQDYSGNTNCQTGITGYNSNAIIRYNHVFSNNIGIKSVNISNLKLLGAQINTPENFSQTINNNTSYEIYSYFDFPYLRYNINIQEMDQVMIA